MDTISSRVFDFMKDSSQSVLLIESETGSGKSTRTPRAVLNYLAMTGDRRRRAVMCQPNRLAVHNLYTSFASSGEHGSSIGFQYSGERDRPKGERVLFTTYGSLLQELLANPTLSTYDILIFDEFHHDDENIKPVIEKCLQTMSVARAGVKIILMSATVSLAFQKLLNLYKSYVINYKPDLKRAFEIKVNHLEVGDGGAYKDAVLSKVDEIVETNEVFSILVFWPTKQDTYRATKEHFLAKKSQALSAGYQDPNPRIKDCWRTITSYALNSETGNLDKCNNQHETRKILNSTNIAETSVTLNNISHIVTTGRRRIKTMNSLGFAELGIDNITPESFVQQSGRGRHLGTNLEGKGYGTGGPGGRD